MNSYRGSNMGIVTDETSLWDTMLSADRERGVSECCGSKAIIRIVDEKKWVECLACGKECELT